MYIFNIDRGGTFTDFYVQKISQEKVVIEQHSFKVPSQSSAGQGPIVGIKKFLHQHNIPNTESGKIRTDSILCINIGTTIATNSLLQRKGSECAVVVSKGFKDILQIRNQSRPNIFDLSCRSPSPLCTHTLTVDSRVYSPCPPPQKKVEELDKNIYMCKASENNIHQLKSDLKKLPIKSIALSLCGGYLHPEPQSALEEQLKDLGIPIYKGYEYVHLGYVKRTETVMLDAYLDPTRYVTINVMKSDGGFSTIESVRASQMLLSGPAGGLIGYSKMSQQIEHLFGLKTHVLLGLDMGGTSTDISKSKGSKLPLLYSFPIEGIELCTPHLQIETIAAGGGSQLTFQNGLLKVGPESVGSSPGPVCYGIGQQLAITDANMILGRLEPEFFPKVFGKSGDMGPNKDLSVKAFEHLFESVPKSKSLPSIYHLAEGFVKLANELMAKSARKLLSSGKADALVVFGSAGGQHCCEIADLIGIDNIIVHKFAGVLSAYGLSMAEQRKQNKVYLGVELSPGFNYQQFIELIQTKNNGEVEGQWDRKVQEVTIAYAGTSFSLSIPLSQKMLEEFESAHLEQNGFSLPNKVYKIDYYIETYLKSGPSYKSNFKLENETDSEKYVIGQSQVFLNGQFETINKYGVVGMKNCNVKGPALMFSDTASILVQTGWAAHVVNQIVYLKKSCLQIDNSNNKQQKQEPKIEECDPIKLTIFSTRLMGIAEEMGKVLQKTSISTNIKERLDFSCGIFDQNGSLLANAPHLPVHLGSMQTAVTEQIRLGIKPGDVILSNHPMAGGSHLPDLTVISCFWIAEGFSFYVASRGHHADIGGTTPGSMPPFSRQLSEEGVAVQSFHLVKNGVFLEKETRQLFKNSRRINDNISDLLAQISANQYGIKLLRLQIKQLGVRQFKSYIEFLKVNSSQSVSEMLCNFSLSNNFPPVHTIQAEQYMDDGTLLALKLTIDRQNKKTIFDFEGTGYQVIGNTNAPKSITRSAVLYCLRSMLGTDIPLNSGCLAPIKIKIKPSTILWPSQDSAVVGGNVETSQKLVSLILKPFELVGSSQSTMNNFLFGNSTSSYYQTICGGSGAGSWGDGTTIQCHMTNTRITDVQHLQKYYPVILNSFQKRQGSGGQGLHNGGEGVEREMLFLQPMEVSVLSENRVFPTYGIRGGQPGKLGQNLLIKADGTIRNIGGKNLFKVSKGDRVRILTPGGGGYGKKQ